MTTPNTGEGASVEPKWFIDEGIAGPGDRPSFLPEKFKSVADMAKSYGELEKKFGQPPESYDLSKSKALDPNYAPFQEFLDLAKERRVPKDVMDKLVDSIDKYYDEFTIDPAEEAKKLGENAKERLDILDNWAKANLSEDSYLALTKNMKSAEAIKAVEELRSKMMSGTTQVPNGNDQAGAQPETLDSLKKELEDNLAKYKTDAKYRENLQARLNIASKNSGYIDKIGA